MDNSLTNTCEGSALSDGELITLWQQGDLSAFDTFYKRYVIQMVSLAAKKINCREIAKEMVQDVFMEFFQQKARLDPANSLKAYLFVILKNKIFNHYRQKMVSAKYELHIVREMAVDENATELNLTQKELGKLLKVHTENLPVKCREVFKLSREEYLSHKEIANRLNISVNTVEQHMRKALSKLKTSLFPYIYLFLILVF